MNFENLSLWVKEKLLPNLPEKSLVVQDAPHHSVHKNKLPTTASRKPEIQEWLRNMEISFSEDMMKS